MSGNIPIGLVTIEHTSPSWDRPFRHTNVFSPNHPLCPCTHVRAIFSDKGMVSFEGPLECFPLTIVEVSVA